MAARAKLLVLSACAGLVACTPSPHEAYESSPLVVCDGVSGYTEAANLIIETINLVEQRELQFRVFGERVDSREEPYWMFVYFPNIKMYLSTGFKGQGGRAYFYRHRELLESGEDQAMQLAEEYLGDEFECEIISSGP